MVGKYKEKIYLAHTDMGKLPYLTQALSSSRASSRIAHKALLIVFWAFLVHSPKLFQKSSTKTSCTFLVELLW